MKTFFVLFIAIFVSGCASMFEDPQIVTVARRGDISQLELLIAAGANVNAETSLTNETAIYAATQYRHTDAVKLLIDSGVSNFDDYYLHPFTGESYTPLMIAAKFNNPEIVTMLLDAGADIDARNAWGDTALMAAVAFDFDNINMAKLLIESGADINATKPDMTTALMIAARKGDAEMINVLLDAGADVNIGLGTGGTALSLAVVNSKKANTSEWFEKCFALHQKGKECQTHPDTSIIKLLIDNGAEVNQLDKEGRTLLDKSIGDMDTELPDFLIESGVDVRQGSPLMSAAYHGNSELVSLLIHKYKLDVNKRVKTKDKYTNKATALHFAAMKGHENVLEILLKEGAEINIQNKNGDTALILAAMNGHIGAVTELINSGADLNIRNKGNYTALKFARKLRLGAAYPLEEAGALE